MRLWIFHFLNGIIFTQHGTHAYYPPYATAKPVLLNELVELCKIFNLSGTIGTNRRVGEWNDGGSGEVSAVVVVVLTVSAFLNAIAMTQLQQTCHHGSNDSWTLSQVLILASSIPLPCWLIFQHCTSLQLTQVGPVGWFYLYWRNSGDHRFLHCADL